MFKEAIISDAKKRAEAIVSEAKKEANKIINERKKYWEKRLNEAEEKAKKEAEEMGNERIAWAKLEAKRIKARAFEKVVEKAIEDVIKVFKKKANTKEFAELIKKVASEIKKEAGDIVIRLPKDSSIDIKGFKVKKDLDSVAGFVVESKDGKVVYSYTVEDMIDLYRDEIRRIVYEKELR